MLKKSDYLDRERRDCEQNMERALVDIRNEASCKLNEVQAATEQKIKVLPQNGKTIFNSMAESPLAVVIGCGIIMAILPIQFHILLLIPVSALIYVIIRIAASSADSAARSRALNESNRLTAELQQKIQTINAETARQTNMIRQGCADDIQRLEQQYESEVQRYRTDFKNKMYAEFQHDSGPVYWIAYNGLGDAIRQMPRGLANRHIQAQWTIRVENDSIMVDCINNLYAGRPDNNRIFHDQLVFRAINWSPLNGVFERTGCAQAIAQGLLAELTGAFNANPVDSTYRITVESANDSTITMLYDGNN